MKVAAVSLAAWALGTLSAPLGTKVHSEGSFCEGGEVRSWLKKREAKVNLPSS